MARQNNQEKNTHALIKVDEVVTTGKGDQYLSCRAAGDFETPEALVEALNSIGVPASLDAPTPRGSSISMSGLQDKYKRIFGHDNFDPRRN